MHIVAMDGKVQLRDSSLRGQVDTTARDIIYYGVYVSLGPKGSKR